MYKDWADGQINKMKTILNSARQDHTAAVQTRIESVKELGGVVDITKNLFEVSKVREDIHTILESNRAGWLTLRLGDCETGGPGIRA